MEFRVADLGLAEFGRKEIRLAEHEMPGLMAMREQYAALPAAGGCPDRGVAAHDRADRGADRDPGRLGAEVRWASCNIFSTQDHAAAAVVVGDGTPEQPAGVPVFAWKGETLEEYWGCAGQILSWPRAASLANMILDDGGDATMLVHMGVEYEKAGEVPEPSEDDSDEP